MPKTQEFFRKTQVFPNSELEIVVEKRPKKDPGLFVLTGAKFSSVSFMDLKGNLKRTLNPLFVGFSGLSKSWSLGSFCFIISKNLPNPCFEILLAKVSFQSNRALAMPISAQIMRKFFASVMVRTSQKLMTPLEYLRNALLNV